MNPGPCSQHDLRFAFHVCAYQQGRGQVDFCTILVDVLDLAWCRNLRINLGSAHWEVLENSGAGQVS